MKDTDFRKVLYYCAKQTTFADVRLDQLMIKAVEHGILGELRCLMGLDKLEHEGIVEICKNIDGDGYTWVRILEPQKLLEGTAEVAVKRAEVAVKRDLAKREWDAEKQIREIVRDELHTAAVVSGENAKLIFELVVPSEIKAEILAGEAQLHIHDREDKLIYVVTAFDIKEGSN